MKALLLAVLMGAVAPLAAPVPAAAGPLDLAAVSCDKYENEIVGLPEAGPTPPPASAAAPGPRPDAIDTVMWLFGFSVAASGDHFMYGDALASFGFALDAQCKDHPHSSLLQALASVTPKRDRPMDLKALNCGTFETRHADSERTDPDSANTIMMWLYGFAAGLSGRHTFDAGGLKPFEASLATTCTREPNASLFETLITVARGTRR